MPEGVLNLREWGTIEGIIEDVRVEEVPSDFSDTGYRSVLVVELRTFGGDIKKFYYPYTSAAHSKLGFLVERVESLVGEIDYLSDIIGYYSRWRQYTKTLEISGEERNIIVWLPTELRPANIEDNKRMEKAESREVDQPMGRVVSSAPTKKDDRPIEERILNYVKNRISMDGAVTIKEVAEEFGVELGKVMEIIVETDYKIRKGVIYGE